MTSKSNITLEIASALLHEADSRELEEIEELVKKEREERRRIGIFPEILQLLPSHELEIPVERLDVLVGRLVPFLPLRLVHESSH